MLLYMKNTFLCVIFCSILTQVSKGQIQDLVIEDSISYPIHKSNIGKIAFMSDIIPIEQFTASDFLISLELTEKTDLNMRVFLGNSLTNYLHQLVPELTATELVQNGNYQFTFLIDSQIVYTENLDVGAGSAESKNQKTVFRIPLISTTNEDSWGRFLWNRFLFNGGQDALTSGIHILKIEIRPYINQSYVLTGDIIAEGQIKLIVPEIEVEEKKIRIQTIKPLNDWPISVHAIDTGLIESLNRKIAAHAYKDITSIVVIQDGQLLLEEYFNGAKRSTLHDTRSVGKSFTSALLGIAIQDTCIHDEMQTLGNFYNLKSNLNYIPEKESITLKQLLTMSSPFAGSDMDPSSPGNEENMYPAENWVKFSLNLPLDSAKIAQPYWDYFTAGVILLGDILNQSVPGGLQYYADKKLFQPLGITKYKWQFTPQKVVNTAGSLRMRSLDLAKYGQLYLNNGTWQGKQVISPEWVSKSLSKQIQIADNEYYGFLFWNKGFLIQDTIYEAYYASGNGGNKIYIFKDMDIVIVVTGTAYNTLYGHRQADQIIQNYLLPAIIN